MYLIMLVPGCILPVYSGDSLLSSRIKFPLLVKKKLLRFFFFGEVLEFVHLYNSSSIFFAELD